MKYLVFSAIGKTRTLTKLALMKSTSKQLICSVLKNKLHSEKFTPHNLPLLYISASYCEKHNINHYLSAS